MPEKFEWYTTKEVADMLDVHPSTALRWGRSKGPERIPGLFKVGCRWRWRKEIVDAFVATTWQAQTAH